MHEEIQDGAIKLGYSKLHIETCGLEFDTTAGFAKLLRYS